MYRLRLNDGYRNGELASKKIPRLNRQCFTFHHYNGRLGWEGEVFGELWIQDMVMEEVDTVIEDFSTETENQEKLTQPMSTPKKTLRFTEENSIFKESSISKRKPIGLTQPYF